MESSVLDRVCPKAPGFKLSGIHENSPKSWCLSLPPGIPTFCLLGSTQ